MKSPQILAGITICLLLFCPLFLAYAQEHQHEHGAPAGGPPEEQMPNDSVGQEEATSGNLLCSPEHMRALLQNPLDKECVADGVLQDKATTEIIMNKIIADPDLRKQMMERMHAEMHKRMMEMQGQGGAGGMKGGQGGTMGGEGAPPKPEESNQ
jgi:hypothetical protein